MSNSWLAAVVHSAFPDSATEGSIQATQMKLKRARLADNLNEKIALRPGPLELVEKNIISVDSAVKEAIKGSSSKITCNVLLPS